MRETKIKTVVLAFAILGLCFFFGLINIGKSHALFNPSTGVNQQISFEGKVVNKTTGVNITDNTYDMEFKIYGQAVNNASQCTNSGGAGCQLLWTEDYIVGSSGGVSLSSGTFVVDLGSITSLSGLNFNQYPLYLSMQIGGTGNCTPAGNFQGNCSGDGEMNPYILLTSTPYSLNSNALNGISSSGFVQTAPTLNTTNVIQPTTNVSSLIVKQGTGTTNDIFDVQNNAATANIIQATGAGALYLSSIGTTQPVSIASSYSNSASTGSITIQSGNASIGSNLNAGTITIDTGTQTGTGTAALNIGSANATAITIGNTAGTTSTTILSGSGGINIGGGGKVSSGSIDNSATNNFSSTSSGTVSLTTTKTNDVWVLYIGYEGLSSSSISSVTSPNLTWSQRKIVNLTPDSAGGYNTLAEYWAPATSALTAETVTVNLSGSIDDATLNIFAVNGTSNYTSPWDSNSSLPASSTGIAGSTNATSNISTTSPYSMIIGSVGNNCWAGGCGSPSIGWSGVSPMTTLLDHGNAGATYNYSSGVSYENVNSTESNLGISMSPDNGSGHGNYFSFIGDALSTQTTTSTSSSLVNIGSVGTSTTASTTNIGTTTDNTSAQLINIGSASGNASNLVTLQGSVKINNIQSATTSNYLCSSATGLISSCNITGTGVAFKQGGNAFGSTASLGTTDTNNLQFITGASGPNIRLTLDQSNDAYFGNGVTASTPTNTFSILGTSSNGNTAGTGITIQGGNAAGAGNNNGGTLTLDAGAKSNNGTSTVNIGTINATGINIGNNATTGSSNTLVLGSIIGNSPITIQSGTSGILVNPVSSQTAFLLQDGGGNNLLSVDSVNNAIMLGLPTVSSGTSSIGTWTTLNIIANNSSNGDMEGSSLAYRGFIYEIGGGTSYSDGGSNVYYAKINSDGTTGAWVQTVDLPSITSYTNNRNATSVAYNGYIYSLGGCLASNTGNPCDISNVYYSKINKNGSLGAWNNTTSLSGISAISTNGIDSATTTVNNGYIYEIGGLTGSWYNHTVGTLAHYVAYAKINSDGTLGSWTSVTPSVLPALEGSVSFVNNNYIYVLGGSSAIDNSGATANGYYAPLNSDGSVGTWSTTTTMPNARVWSGVAVYQNKVFVLGGSNTSGALVNSSGLTKATINNDGTLSAWSSAATGAYKATMAGAAVYNGYVYQLGGSSDSTNPLLTSNFAYAPISGTITGSTGDPISFNINGNNTIKPIFDDLNVFQVQNASGLQIIGVDTINNTLNLQQVSGGNINIGTNTGGGEIVTIGSTDNTNALTLGQSTVGETINIGNGNLVSAANIINIGTAGDAASTESILVGNNSNSSSIALYGGSGAGAISAQVAAGGSISIGTSNQNQTITIGSSNSGSTTGSVTIRGGSGSNAISLQAKAGGTIVIGVGFANAVTIGNTANTNTLTLGQSTAGETINIGNGNVATGNTNTINIGATATSTGKDVVTLGSLIAASTTSIQGGTGAGAVSIQSGASGTISVGTTVQSQTITVGSTALSSGTQTINIGNSNTSGGTTNISIGCGSTCTGGTTSVTAKGALTLTGNGASTWSTAGSALTINGGTTLTLGSSSGSTISIQPGGAGAITFGTSSTGNDSIGNTTGLHTLVGPNYTTSTKGVCINTTTAACGTLNASIILLDLNQSSLQGAEAAGNCSTTINAGGLYYSASTASSNTTTQELRGCINGAWTDVVTSDQLGLIILGVVSNSGSNAGDIGGITGVANGPCKVSWASSTSVSVAPCTAYSNGRKVVLTSAQTVTSLSAASSYYHICLNGTNNAPAATTANASETAALPAFSATSPKLCLATVLTGAGSTITNIWDTRIFVEDIKQFITTTAAMAPGWIAVESAANQVTTSTSASAANVAGIIAVGSTAGSTTTINGIMITQGPAFVSATTGTSSTYTAGNTAQTSSTAGYAISAATLGLYKDLGLVINPPVNSACSASTNCQFSMYVNISPH